MTENESKFVLALWGGIAAIVGSVVSIITFFYRDARQRFERRLAGRRALVLLVETMLADLESGSTAVANVKVDWLMPYVDVLLADAETYIVLQAALKARAKMLAFQPGRSVLMIDLKTDVERVRRDALDLLSKWQIRAERWLFLLRR